jgi:hypothetical protein
MKKFTLGVLLFVLALTVNNAVAQTLVTWSTFPSSAWNATWTPNSVDPTVTVTDFTKGAGILGSGTPAGSAWGGSGGWGSASDNSTNGSMYFTIQANAGYKLSLASIPTFYSRRSNSGPTGATVLYSIDGGVSYVSITTVTTSSTSTAGTNNPISTLGTIDALQNVPSTTPVMIKIVPNSASNNWYINSGGFVLNGSTSIDAPLPVTLVSFTGTAQQNGVLLNWKTATEVNSSHYELEKSNDGKNFNYVTTVASKNSNTGASYDYMDKTSNTTAYYRLKTVDYNNNFEYSDVIRVGGNATTQNNVVTLKTNPVKDRITFTSTSANQQSTYQLIGLSGAVVGHGTVVSEEGVYQIYVSGLPAGMYVLHLNDGSANNSVKFVKQ